MPHHHESVKTYPADYPADCPNEYREAEVAIVGHLLVTGKADEIIPALSRDHFHDDDAKFWFGLIEAAIHEETPFDWENLSTLQAHEIEARYSVPYPPICYELLDRGEILLDIPSAVQKLQERANKERYRAFASELAKAADGGKSSAELDRMAEQGLAGIRAEQKSPIQFKTLAELQNETFPHLQWIVDDIFPEGLTILAGPPKIGKSFVALGTAVSVATGGNAFGNRPVEQGNVLYFALEDNDRRIQTRVSAMLPDGQQWPENFQYVTSCPTVEHGGMEHLESAIREHRPRVVFIDTMKVFFGSGRKGKKRGNAYEMDYAELSEVHKMATRLKTSIFFLHHTRKSGPSDTDDIFETVSGSYGITAAADTIAVLARRRGQVVLAIRPRDAEEAEYAMERDNRIGGWKIIGEAAEVKDTETKQAIYDVFRDSPGVPINPKAIADATGIRPDTVRRTLGKLTADGTIIKSGYGQYLLLEEENTGHTGHTGHTCHTGHTGHTSEDCGEVWPDGETCHTSGHTFFPNNDEGLHQSVASVATVATVADKRDCRGCTHKNGGYCLLRKEGIAMNGRRCDKYAGKDGQR